MMIWEKKRKRAHFNPDIKKNKITCNKNNRKRAILLIYSTFLPFDLVFDGNSKRNYSKSKNSSLDRLINIVGNRCYYLHHAVRVCVWFRLIFFKYTCLTNAHIYSSTLSTKIQRFRNKEISITCSMWWIVLMLQKSQVFNEYRYSERSGNASQATEN